MTRKTVLITGATDGLGKALADAPVIRWAVKPADFCHRTKTAANAAAVAEHVAL